jgi:hypothetical protein
MQDFGGKMLVFQNAVPSLGRLRKYIRVTCAKRRRVVRSTRWEASCFAGLDCSLSSTIPVTASGHESAHSGQLAYDVPIATAFCCCFCCCIVSNQTCTASDDPFYNGAAFQASILAHG